jgi:CRP-like cAMP-binding protein
MFSHFTDEQLARLAQCASAVHHPADALVVKEGERSRGVYLLASGNVRIQRKTPYGLFALASLGPGSLFGETSFVDRGPRSGDAVATTADTELVAFDADALDAASQADQRLHLALSWLFWKSLSAKLRQTNENLTSFFEETGRPDVSEPITHFQAGGDLYIDMATKRKLFQEMKLSNLEINFLSTLSREKAFSANQVIFREGENAHEMYVVLEGRVMISKFIPGAGEEALAFLERGGYFGEMALIDNEPRSADAKAHDEGAVVLAIPREVLEGILDIHKVSSLRLLNVLCNLVAGRLREIDDKLITWFILAGGSGISWPVDQPQVSKRRQG